MNESLKKKYVPPDGGWGWMVLAGHGLSHLFLIPMVQNFTLLFKERFVDLNFSSTDISTLISLNASFGFIVGVINGPILKIFGYRKLALAGGTLYILGNFCTGVANSLVEFIIYYGMMFSLGMIMTMSAFSLALNSYFLEKRSKAVGYTMTIASLGSMLMPIIVSEFLSSYGLKWTVFLLSGLSLNIYVGALLLQPIKWHMKEVLEETPTLEQTKTEKEEVISNRVNSFSELSYADRESLYETNKRNKFWSQDSLVNTPKNLTQMKENWEKQKQSSMMFLDNEDYKSMMSSALYMIEDIEPYEKKAKYASAETLGLENTQNLFEYEIQETQSSKLLEAKKEKEEEETGTVKKILYFLRDIYDVDLLHDPIFLNTLLGLSIASVGEIVFSVMTPLIFAEYGFSVEESATFMSIIAGADLVCRFIAPYAGKQIQLGSKSMYLLSLFFLILSRASIYLASTYVHFATVSFALGVGKGFRTVFWGLVVPDYVPLSKLPSASAFVSLSKGIMLLISGPLMGVIIGINNKYSNIILASNILSFTTITLWCGEMIFLRFIKKNKK